MTPQQQIEKILRDNHLKIDYEFNFAKYKELPIEVELAMKVLIKHGMKLTFILQEVESDGK